MDPVKDIGFSLLSANVVFMSSRFSFINNTLLLITWPESAAGDGKQTKKQQQQQQQEDKTEARQEQESRDVETPNT